MSLEDEEFTPPEASEEFVPVVFARSADQAEVYCELLNDHDIPAVPGEVEDADDDSPAGRPPSMARGVPVLVPEALLDEAGEVIAEREDAEGEFELGEEDLDDDEDEFDDLDEGFSPGPPDDEDDYLIDLDDEDEEDEEEQDGDEDDEEL